MNNLHCGVVITNTTAVTGTFRAILVLANAVFTTLTAKGHTTNGAVTQSVGADYGTVNAGTMLYGTFSAITLTSGKVIAYK
jgi:chitinase